MNISKCPGDSTILDAWDAVLTLGSEAGREIVRDMTNDTKRFDTTFDTAAETAALKLAGFLRAKQALFEIYEVARDEGYAGKYLDLYCCIAGMDDVDYELEMMGRGE